MIGLDYLLILEGLILVCAGIFFAIGETLGKNNPNDTLKLTMRAFWQELLRRGQGPEPMLEVGPTEAELERDRLAAKKQKKAAAQGATASAVLNVKVEAGDGSNQIAGKAGNDVRIRVATDPESGEANKIIIDLLAECLDIQGYRIKLVRGHYQVRKSFQIAGLTLDEVEEKLAKFF